MWLQELVLVSPQAEVLPDAGPRVPRTVLALVRGESALKVLPGQMALVVVLRGGISVHTGEGSLEQSARSWLLVDRDGGPTLQGHRDCLALVVVMNAQAQRQLIQQGIAELFPGRGRISRECLAFLCRSLRQMGAAQEEFWRREPALRVLFDYIANAQADLRQMIARCPGRSRNRRMQVMTRLQRARLYMEANASRVVRIGELASIASFSHWYFTKSFHRVYGMSPIDFGVSVRLGQARQLLRRPELSVSDIAAACGFENLSAFARAFRRQFGVSASRLRVEDRIAHRQQLTS